jgi:hypothetical protein
VGGLFAAGAAVLEPLERGVAAVLPVCRLVEAEMPPALGACLLARNTKRGEPL